VDAKMKRNPGDLLRIASDEVEMRESVNIKESQDKHLPSKRKASMLVHSLYNNHVKTPLYE
jgi:hypothetical protein